MAIAVQQALHGYSDGHRLISSSLQLSSADARTMLVMSDLSGPGVKPDALGYLTGYPLEGAGKYVLARTWAAPEMPRPGCVWTHSLLIDNADLAAIKSAAGLLQAFQRPSGRPHAAMYSAPIEVVDLPVDSTMADDERTRTVTNALYTIPDRCIVAEAGLPVHDDRLVVAIWMQQWPRLRRSFGFCTLAGVDRSAKGAALDLQLIPSAERQLRSKFPNAATPADAPLNSTLDTLVADLAGLDRTQIREFLRRTGGDVDGGRRAMLPLCRLHASLFETSPPKLGAAVQALAELDELGSRQARSVRTLVARQAIEDLKDVDDTVFEFLLETLDQAGLSEDPGLGPQLGRGLWQRWPQRFVHELGEAGPLGQACAEALRDMPLGLITEGLERDARLATAVVRTRPDLLEEPTFWRISGVDDDLAFETHGAAAGRVAAALISAKRVSPAIPYLVDRADLNNLVEALENGAADSSVLGPWLYALTRDPNRAAAALASGRVRQMSTLAVFAQTIEPDTVPNDYGEDPWVAAIRRASGPTNDRDLDYLTAFLMSRALGNRSRSQAELIRFAYSRVYFALEQSRLPAGVEGMVTWRLDWVAWFQWDNCARLRETATRKFVDQHLDPETFGRLANEGELALALFEEAARTGKGRRYLSEVRQALKNSDDPAMRARADYISKKIK